MLNLNNVQDNSIETNICREPSLFTKVSTQNFHQIQPKAFRKTNFNFLADNLNVKPVTDGVKEEDVYEDNSGTTLSIVIKDKLVIAADTRHSAMYNINSRNMTKIYRIGNLFLTTAGFYADGFEVCNVLTYQIKKYETVKPITLQAASHLLFNILYSRRFFPYYTYATLSGFEETEEGTVPAIYAFDSIGSYERLMCQCNGSGATMIQPLLDSWVSGKNFLNFEEKPTEFMISLVKKAFDSVAERDVRTKDFIEMYIIDAQNVETIEIPLRKD